MVASSGRTTGHSAVSLGGWRWGYDISSLIQHCTLHPPTAPCQARRALGWYSGSTVHRGDCSLFIGFKDYYTRMNDAWECKILKKLQNPDYGNHRPSGRTCLYSIKNDYVTSLSSKYTSESDTYPATHCNGSDSWRDTSLFKMFKKNDCFCSATESGDTHIYNTLNTTQPHKSNHTSKARQTSQKRPHDGYQSQRTGSSSMKVCPLDVTWILSTYMEPAQGLAS